MTVSLNPGEFTAYSINTSTTITEIPNVTWSESGTGGNKNITVEVTPNGGTYFQSYDSVIAYRTNEGKIYLDNSTWNYSVTTGKYRNQFLSEGIAETRKKIANGQYTLTDLN